MGLPSFTFDFGFYCGPGGGAGNPVEAGLKRQGMTSPEPLGFAREEATVLPLPGI